MPNISSTSLDSTNSFYFTGAYRYSFQGQEHDDEIKGAGNSINYTFRMHDPRIGRFFAVDPLTSKYPHYTPYSFSGNKVIHAIELEGLEEHLLNNGETENAPIPLIPGATNGSIFFNHNGKVGDDVDHFVNSFGILDQNGIQLPWGAAGGTAGGDGTPGQLTFAIPPGTTSLTLVVSTGAIVRNDVSHPNGERRVRDAWKASILIMGPIEAAKGVDGYSESNESKAIQYKVLPISIRPVRSENPKPDDTPLNPPVNN